MEYYPRNGVWHWITGEAPTPLGENRWASLDDAKDFSSQYNDAVNEFGIECSVVNEFSPEHPQFPWRVLCSGTGSR